MVINTGNIVQADDIMGAFGIQFKNSMNSFFNSEYDGWNSKLGGDGQPVMKNLAYSILSTDIAAANYAWDYDSTNDLYKTVDLTSANLVYFDIYATSVNTGTLTDTGNNIWCTQISSGIWRLYSWKNSVNEALQRAIEQLFDGLSAAATDPNGVTTLTDLRCSESTYRSHDVKFISGSVNNSWTQYGYVDYDFSASGTKYYFNVYGTTNSNMIADLEGPDTTVLLNWPSGNTIDRRGTGTFYTWSGSSGRYNGHAGAVGSYTGTCALTILFPTTETLTTGTSGTGASILVESGIISIGASAPDIATYPIGVSTLIFKNTSASTVTNTITTWNDEGDVTSLYATNPCFETAIGSEWIYSEVDATSVLSSGGRVTDMYGGETCGTHSYKIIKATGDTLVGVATRGRITQTMDLSKVTQISVDYALKSGQTGVADVVANARIYVDGSEIVSGPSATMGAASASGDTTGTITGTVPASARRPGVEVRLSLVIYSTAINGTAFEIWFDNVILRGHGIASMVASISYDGGSNYETITDSTIQRNTNTGTAMWLKFTNTRTDLSTEDEFTEWATGYNWY